MRCWNTGIIPLTVLIKFSFQCGVLLFSAVHLLSSVPPQIPMPLAAMFLTSLHFNDTLVKAHISAGTPFLKIVCMLSEIYPKCEKVTIAHNFSIHCCDCIIFTHELILSSFTKGPSNLLF